LKRGIKAINAFEKEIDELAKKTKLNSEELSKIHLFNSKEYIALKKKEMLAHKKAQEQIKKDVKRAERIRRTELEKSKARMQNFLRYVQNWALRLGVFLSVGAVLRGIKELTLGLIDQARQIDQLSKITGFTTEALSGLDLAAKTYLISTEQLQRALAFMNKSVSLLNEGVKDQVVAFKALNIKYEDLRKLKPEEQLNLIAERFSKLTDSNTRARVAIALFERTGREFIPILQALGEDSEQFNERVRESGAVMEKGFVNNAIVVGQQIEAMKKSFTGLGISLSTEFLPVLSSLIVNLDTVVKHWSGLNKAIGRTEDTIKSVEIVLLESTNYWIDWAAQINAVQSIIAEFMLAIDRFGAKFPGQARGMFNIGVEYEKKRIAELKEELTTLLNAYDKNTEKIKKLRAALIAKQKEEGNASDATATFTTKEEDLEKAIERTNEQMKKYYENMQLTSLGIQDLLPWMTKMQDEWEEFGQKGPDMLDLDDLPDPLADWTPKIPTILDVENRSYEIKLEKRKKKIESVAQSMASNFSTFFQSVMKDAKNFEDYWKGLLRSILNSFIQMISDMIAKKMMAAAAGIILDMFATGPMFTTGGVPIEPIMTPYKSGGYVSEEGKKKELPKFDTGGYFTGTGNVGFPAMLHPREYVVNESYFFDFLKTATNRMFSGMGSSSVSNVTNNANRTNNYTPTIYVTVNSLDLNNDIDVKNLSRKISDAQEEDMRRRGVYDARR
jgi:Mg2+ and Co2+ transporter CorA